MSLPQSNLFLDLDLAIVESYELPDFMFNPVQYDKPKSTGTSRVPR